MRSFSFTRTYADVCRRIQRYETLWSALVPTTPLSEAETFLETMGVEECVKRIKGRENPSLPGPVSSSLSSKTTGRSRKETDHLVVQVDRSGYPPLSVDIQSPICSLNPTTDHLDLSFVQSLPVRNTSFPSTDPQKDLLPVTRATSPTALPLPSAYDFHQDDRHGADDYSWHEGDTSNGILDGMGGDPGPSHRGTSFVGLSSSATFLHAIDRFASRCGISTEDRHNPHPTFPSQIASPFANGSTQVSTMQPLASKQLDMPSWSEVKPLVDSYFQYFREYTLCHVNSQKLIVA